MVTVCSCHLFFPEGKKIIISAITPREPQPCRDSEGSGGEGLRENWRGRPEACKGQEAWSMHRWTSGQRWGEGAGSRSKLGRYGHRVQVAFDPGK